jgi:hypothetical protein
MFSSGVCNGCWIIFQRDCLNRSSSTDSSRYLEKTSGTYQEKAKFLPEVEPGVPAVWYGLFA